MRYHHVSAAIDSGGNWDNQQLEDGGPVIVACFYILKDPLEGLSQALQNATQALVAFSSPPRAWSQAFQNAYHTSSLLASVQLRRRRGALVPAQGPGWS